MQSNEKFLISYFTDRGNLSRITVQAKNEQGAINTAMKVLCIKRGMIESVNHA